MTTLLLVDDEKSIIELERLYLEKEGYGIEVAYDGKTALEKFRSVKPAAVILDLMLPGVDGWEVCRRIRQDSDVPILMLTARDQDMDKIIGLELGADDYLTKPFNPRELVARATSSAESPVAETHQLSVGDLNMDLDRREVTANGKAPSCAPRNLICWRCWRRTQASSWRERLLEIAWGYDLRAKANGGRSRRICARTWLGRRRRSRR
jgi:DNA-binding response OmpR family regulator